MTPQNQEIRVNPFMKIKLDGALICDLLLDQREFELPHIKYVEFLCQITGTLRFEDLVVRFAEVFAVGREQAEESLQDLINSRVLVYEGDMDPRVDAVQHWIDRGWLDAAILHLKSRDLSFIDDRVDDPESVKRAVLLDEVESNPPPAFWKNYPSSQKIFLPKPTDLPSDRLLPEVLLARRSLAPYRGGGLNAIELGNILHYASLETVRLRTAAEETLRTSPELLLASSFSAIEIYPIILDVEGIAPGLYHFDPRDGGLSLLKSGYFREEAAKVCIGQSRAGASGVTLVFTAVWERYMYRYRHARAYRNLLINVAQLAQKILVLATSYRLGTFMTPAIDDEYAEQFLNLQWQEEAPLYVVAAG